MTNEFNAWLAGFKTTDLWAAMARTVEDSPWHREANVGVHTEMLLDVWRTTIQPTRPPRQALFTAIACTFHDTGKPPAEIHKFSEARGNYRAYHGHEQVSARLWTDYALSNPEFMARFSLSLADVSNLAFAIEHHVPFDMKDAQKRRALKATFFDRGGKELHQSWLDLLYCDQYGRTSDDQEVKLARVHDWLRDWENVYV